MDAGPPNARMPGTRYVQDDMAAARMLLADMKDIVCGVASITSCASKLSKLSKLYVRDGIAWTDNKVAVDAIFFKTCMNSNIKKINNKGVEQPYSAMLSKATTIVRIAKGLIDNDAGFEQRMCASNIGVVCFANGLYDFRKGAFFTYPERPDVLPRFYVNRDFPTSRPSPEFLEEVSKKVLLSTLGNRGYVKTYLETIARAMAGNQEQCAAIMLGERNSGKSLLQSINESAWGPYVNTFGSNVTNCEFRRQTYADKYDSCTAIKSFVIMNLNDLPPVYPHSALLSLFKFPFKFVPFFRVADPELKTQYCTRDDVINAFIWLVVGATPLG